MSIEPAAVCMAGTVKVYSGSIMETFGNTSWLNSDSFSLVSGLEITAPASASLPVAARVSTVTMGSAFVISA